MMYTKDEVFEFIEQEDVKFIRLFFCDINGRQKNISIMPSELDRAFEEGISFDASQICGFGDIKSDLLLFPLPHTLNVLPWRPSHGKVVRMFCDIRYQDKSPFPKDSRNILQSAVQAAHSAGISVQIGSEYEFYLFKLDENGNPTKIPFDNAGYLDVAPEDKGENVRREICLTLLDMGIQTESSRHKEGPGQNEIVFRYSDALRTADNDMNFITVVKTTAQHNGLYADFSPKPLEGESGNGLHINLSVKSLYGKNVTMPFLAGIIEHIREMTYFLNPVEESYKRLGENKAPKYITWSPENRSQLIRIPPIRGEHERIELRSPDPTANPYIAYALLIYAGLDGIQKNLTPPQPVNINLQNADKSVADTLNRLPESLAEAELTAKSSKWIQNILPFRFE